MTSSTKGVTLNSKIRHTNGTDYIVEGMPYHDKFYCRTADSKKEFKVVKLQEVEFVHSQQTRLEF